MSIHYLQTMQIKYEINAIKPKITIRIRHVDYLCYRFDERFEHMCLCDNAYLRDLVLSYNRENGSKKFAQWFICIFIKEFCIDL